MAPEAGSHGPRSGPGQRAQKMGRHTLLSPVTARPIGAYAARPRPRTRTSCALHLTHRSDRRPAAPDGPSVPHRGASSGRAQTRLHDQRPADRRRNNLTPRPAQRRGENQDGLELLASVPVGARGGSEGGMFIAPLPVGVPDGAERLRIITQATATGKRRPDQGVAGIVAMPASLARLGVAWAKRAAASHINLYVTNVPGPTSTLYFAGTRLLQAVPLAPLVAGVRLSVTAMSYDGHFAVSLLADNDMPDLPVLAAGVQSYINASVSSSRA
jgi:hypothetical protein